MMGGDAREEWDGSTMPDSRVNHFWDGKLYAGRWLAKNVNGYEGIAWDIYYLFGPDAVWENIRSAFVGSGQTIYGEREQLRSQITPLME